MLANFELSNFFFSKTFCTWILIVSVYLRSESLATLKNCAKILFVMRILPISVILLEPIFVNGMFKNVLNGYSNDRMKKMIYESTVQNLGYELSHLKWSFRYSLLEVLFRNHRNWYYHHMKTTIGSLIFQG